MNNEDSYQDWFSDNQFDVVTLFAVNSHRLTDKWSLFAWLEEFPIEIEDLGREMYRDECLLTETNEVLINQKDRGVF